MRLKGPAKNVDVATLLYEQKRMMELWSHFMVCVEDHFILLENTVALASLRPEGTAVAGGSEGVVATAIRVSL